MKVLGTVTFLENITMDHSTAKSEFVAKQRLVSPERYDALTSKWKEKSGCVAWKVREECKFSIPKWLPWRNQARNQISYVL